MAVAEAGISTSQSAMRCTVSEDRAEPTVIANVIGNSILLALTLLGALCAVEILLLRNPHPPKWQIGAVFTGALAIGLAVVALLP